MSEGLESIPTIASRAEIDSSVASELGIDESALSIEKRQEATWKIIEDIQSLKSKIQESSEIANIVTYKNKMNSLAGKAVVLNYGLINSAAKSYFDKGIEKEDILQDAFLAAQKAFISFDPQRSPKNNYSTYVYDCVEDRLHQSFNSSNLVHIPGYLIPSVIEYRKAKFNDAYEKTPDEVILSRLYPYYYGFYLEEKDRRLGRYTVAEFLRNRPRESLAFNKRKENVEKANNSISIEELDAPVYLSSVNRGGEYIPRSRESTLGEELAEPDQGGRPVEDALEDPELVSYIGRLLENSDLSVREAEILKLRLGFHDGVEHTLEEVSQVFNVTRERIRQLEARAIRKFRRPLIRKKLRDYL